MSYNTTLPASKGRAFGSHRFSFTFVLDFSCALNIVNVFMIVPYYLYMLVCVVGVLIIGLNGTRGVPPVQKSKQETDSFSLNVCIAGYAIRNSRVAIKGKGKTATVE